jgi:hypothetical protein
MSRFMDLQLRNGLFEIKVEKVVTFCLAISCKREAYDFSQIRAMELIPCLCFPDEILQLINP